MKTKLSTLTLLHFIMKEGDCFKLLLQSIKSGSGAWLLSVTTSSYVDEVDAVVSTLTFNDEFLLLKNPATLLDGLEGSGSFKTNPSLCQIQGTVNSCHQFSSQET